MKKQNIEVEGGELIIKNSNGDYAIIPKKYRQEVQGMIDDGCYDCIDNLVKTLPVMDDYAEDGTLIPKTEDPPSEVPGDVPGDPIPPKKKRVVVLAEAPIEHKYKYNLSVETEGEPEEITNYRIRHNELFDKGRNITPEEMEELDHIYNSFHNPEINPNDGKREETFIIEGNNVKEFYKNDHNVEVDVVPFYNQPDLVKEKLSSLTEDDDLIIMGHKGKKIGGMPLQDISTAIKESKVGSCYLGSCNFEEYIDIFKETGKNVYYRPNSQWLGFDPTAGDFIKGMFGRDRRVGSEGPEDYRTEPEIGKQYDVLNAASSD